MAYNIEIRKASKNGYFTPAEARNYYGKYSRVGLTVHWWNSPDRVKDSDHNNIVNYMLGNASRGSAPTVNYVLSNTKITYLISPDNVAWCSNNGNSSTISVECSPHLNGEGYKKLGWLLSELESRYGKRLALYGHNNWVQTQCPGNISLNRIRQEADKWKAGAYNPKPAPAPTPTPKPVTPPTSVVTEWKRWKEPVEYVTELQPTHLWDFNSEKWAMKSVKQFNKGERVKIVGHAHNKVLNRDYYLTEYSFSKKITNGFNPADLEPYVAPRPVPVPKPAPNPVVVPKDETPVVDSELDELDKRVTKLEGLVETLTQLVNKIVSWLTSFKK